MRHDAEEILYEASKEGLTCAKEDFLESLRDWDLHLVGQGAVVAIKDNQIHASCLLNTKGKWITSGVLRGFLEPILEGYGCVITGVIRGSVVGENFVKRVGFQYLESYGVCDIYILDKNHYKWGKKL